MWNGKGPEVTNVVWLDQELVERNEPSFFQKQIKEHELMGKNQVKKNKKQLKGVKMTPSERKNFGLK